MKKIRLIYRLLGIAFVLALFYIGIVSSIFIRDKVKRHKKTSRLFQILTKMLMYIMGFTIKTEGREYLKSDKNYLIVANHIGYIDILLLHFFIHNNFFISHHEVREDSPFLNFIASKAGAYFIERRNLQNLRKELRETTELLQKGFHVVMFPEGTSTNGEKILPFHPPFFSIAIRSKIPVLPVYINYEKIENQPFNIQNRDLICWYDNKISFKDHFFKLLQIKSINAKVKFLPTLNPEDKTSRLLATESREQIQKHFTGLHDAKPGINSYG